MVVGPERAGWPEHLRTAWQAQGARAERVRGAYRRATAGCVIEVTPRWETTDAGAGLGRGFDTAVDAGRPQPGEPSTDSGALPPGVRRAPPLDP